MSMKDLPNMYAQSPKAADLRAEGIHIRQIMSAHVKNHPNLQLAALHIYITKGSRCNYGFLILLFL